MMKHLMILTAWSWGWRCRAVALCTVHIHHRSRSLCAIPGPRAHTQDATLLPCNDPGRDIGASTGP